MGNKLPVRRVPEQSDIAFVRPDVIDYAGRHNDAARLTHAT